MLECLLADDVDNGKAVLRDSINATIGFKELSRGFDKSSKSLMRMFGRKGNPQASNLFAVIHYLREREGIHLEVKTRKVGLRGGVWQLSVGNFSEHFEDFLSMVSFMVLPHTPIIKPLILSRRNGSFPIEWE